MMFSFSDFSLKLYNLGTEIPQNEIYFEDIVCVVTDQEEKIVDMTLKGKDEDFISNKFQFSNKDIMYQFVEQFGKAKVICESSLKQIDRLKNPGKATWLKEVTLKEDQVIKQNSGKAIILRAIVNGIGVNKEKYLMFPKQGNKFIIQSKNFDQEELINFSNIIHITREFSSYEPFTMTYKGKSGEKSIEITLLSVKDALWLRSAIYCIAKPEMILSKSETSLKTIQIKAFALTFNLNRKPFQIAFEHIFKKAGGAQLICLCLQEVPLLSKNSILNSVLTYCKGKGLEPISQISMWEMALIVFLSKPLIPHVCHIEKKELTAGFLNLVGNKGGLMIAFDLMDSKMAFIGVHLKHGQKNLEQRNSTLWKLFRCLQSGSSSVELQLQADHCLLLGDTNYRINHSFEIVAQAAAKKDYDKMIQLDQLSHEKSIGRILYKFQVTKSFIKRIGKKYWVQSFL